MNEMRDPLTARSLLALRNALRRDIDASAASAVALETLRLADMLLLRLASDAALQPLDKSVATPEILSASIKQETVAAELMLVWQADTVPADAPTSLSKQALERYLRQRQPAWGAVEVERIEEIVGGRSKRTFLVELRSCEEAPPALVLRMDTQRYRTSVLDEHLLLQSLEVAGLPLPQVLWLEADTTLFGQAFLVCRRSLGQPPGTLWAASAHAPEVGEAFARVLGRLHGFRPKADAALSSRSAVVAMVDSYAERWRQTPSGDSAVISAAYDWVGAEMKEMDFGTLVWVHGDAGLHNVLMDGETLTCILDWEFAHLGDAAEDLAYCRDGVSSSMSWSEFLKLYQSYGGPPVDERRVRFFELLKDVRNVTLAAETRSGLATGDMNGLGIAVTANDSFPKLVGRLAERLKVLQDFKLRPS